MLLKPGWIIFLLMFWVVFQLVSTIDYAVLGDTNAALNNGYSATYNSGQSQNVGLSGNTSPMMVLLNTGVGIIRSNPIVGAGQLLANWPDITDAIWSVLTFNAPFLSGTWALIGVVLTCVYAGFTISLIYNVVTKVF